MKHIVLIMLTLAVVVSCKQEQQEEAHVTESVSRIGKYLYVENKAQGYIIHVSKSCANLRNREGAHVPIGVEFVKPDDLEPTDLDEYCPRCVSDEDFETLTGKKHGKR